MSSSVRIEGLAEVVDAVPRIKAVRMSTYLNTIDVPVKELPAFIAEIQRYLPKEQIGTPVPTPSEVSGWAKCLGLGGGK